MRFKERPKTTPEQIAKIEKQRTQSDAELLKGGAQYEIDEKGEKVLVPTRKQLLRMQEPTLSLKEKRELRWANRLEKYLTKTFDFKPEQIASTSDEINEDTKLYYGELDGNAINAIQQYIVAHVIKHQSFERWLNLLDLRNLKTTENRPRSIEEIKENLTKRKVSLSEFSQKMIERMDFVYTKDSEKIDLIRVRLSDLGLPDGISLEDIYRKAKEFGLELCPPEIGALYPYHDDYPYAGEIYNIAMQPIETLSGGKHIFSLSSSKGKKILKGSYVKRIEPWQKGERGSGYESRAQFIFRLPKIKNQE